MAKVSVQQQARRNNRNAHEVKDERDSGRAILRNFGSTSSVNMYWGYNEAMREDGMFKIRIDDKEAIINAEELRRFLRWV